MEKVELEFTEDGLEEMAQRACEMNERVENIGARRLHTIVERVLEDINFSASDTVRREDGDRPAVCTCAAWTRLWPVTI